MTTTKYDVNVVVQLAAVADLDVHGRDDGVDTRAYVRPKLDGQRRTDGSERSSCRREVMLHDSIQDETHAPEAAAAASDANGPDDEPEPVAFEPETATSETASGGGSRKRATKRHVAKKAPKVASQRERAKFNSLTDPRLPKVGTVIERKHKGKTLKVTVTRGGLTYKGKTYGSISRVAEVITGHATNGYVWFGLGASKPTKAAGKPKGSKGAGRPAKPRKKAKAKAKAPKESKTKAPKAKAIQPAKVARKATGAAKRKRS